HFAIMLNKLEQPIYVFDWLEVHTGVIALALQLPVWVPDVRNAAGHARSEIASDTANADDDAAGHIFAAVITHALDHCDRSGVTNGKAFSGDSGKVSLALDCAVEAGIPYDDIFMRLPPSGLRWTHDQAAARQTLADIVVRIANEFERQAAGKKGSEALSCSSDQPSPKRARRQSFVTETTSDLAGGDGPD